MKKLIYIVDDEPAIAKLLSYWVHDKWDYAVEVFTDGEQALKKLTAKPDLVLLDIMMPKKDGIEVLEALKLKPAKNPKVRIVLLTNLAHDPVIKKATELGASGYIIKTDIFPGDLVNKVNEYLALN